MEFKSQARSLHISARKMRLVADLVRGQEPHKANLRLEFSGKKAGGLLMKVIDSAVSNATHNFQRDPKDLIISQIYVDEGPRLKRIRFASRGRANPYQKHLAHVTVVLGEKHSDSKATTVVKTLADKPDGKSVVTTVKDSLPAESVADTKKPTAKPKKATKTNESK